MSARLRLLIGAGLLGLFPANAATAQDVVPGGWDSQVGYLSFGAGAFSVPGDYGYGLSYGTPGVATNPGAWPNPSVTSAGLNMQAHAGNNLFPLATVVRRSVRKRPAR